MSELMYKQNQAVLQEMQKYREYTAEQTEAISWKISQAHKAVVHRIDAFVREEYKCLEEEIEQLEQQLLVKIAERNEWLAWCYQVGVREGLQMSVEVYLENTGGEKRETTSVNAHG